jgi:hypothetical protein
MDDACYLFTSPGKGQNNCAKQLASKKLRIRIQWTKNSSMDAFGDREIFDYFRRTIWATALFFRTDGFDGREVHSADLRRLLDEQCDIGLCEPIKNVFTLTARIQQTCLTQCHQVLRDICLAITEPCFQMTDTGFARTDGPQNLQPRQRGDGLEQENNGLKGISFCHIYLPECIV